MKDKHPKVTDVIVDSSNGKYDIIKVCFAHEMLKSSGMRPLNDSDDFSFYMPFWQKTHSAHLTVTQWIRIMSW